MRSEPSFSTILTVRPANVPCSTCAECCLNNHNPFVLLFISLTAEAMASSYLVNTDFLSSVFGFFFAVEEDDEDDKVIAST